MASIIDAVNESTDATACQGSGDCQRGETCLTHHLWLDLSEQIHSFLDGISLGELIEREEIRHISQRQDAQQSSKVPLAVVN